MRNIFGFLALPMIDNKIELSKSILSEFLVDWGGKDLMASRIRDMCMAVEYITGKGKQSLKMYQYKKKLLTEREWALQKEELCSALIMGS
jgi:hypothetical protein